ncbi:hypothetical protein [Streptomyces sp. Inha503]|uniref:hypothetical protein n=1 Tax=Streptomyces sp. Inha503 TaxID=3383314 RepID=UPI0039A3E9B6
MGLLITPITTTVTSGILAQDAGAASGLMNATRQIGGALGLATLVALAATTSGTTASYRAVFVTIAAACAGVAALALALPAAVSRSGFRDHAPPSAERAHRGP